ncbi:MAG: hypothetical protein WC860_09800, partial [Candidatus Margulisiibacteriota bacterium]
ISKKNLDVLVALWNNAGENQNIRDKITYWFSNNNVPDLDRPLLLTNVRFPRKGVGILQNTPIEVLDHSREFLHGFDSFFTEKATTRFNSEVHAANQMFDFNRGKPVDPLIFFNEDIFNEYQIANEHGFENYSSRLVLSGRRYLKECWKKELPDNFFLKLLDWAKESEEKKAFLDEVITELRRDVMITRGRDTSAQGVLDLLAPVAIPQQKSEGKVTKEFVNAYAVEVAAVKQAVVTQAIPQIMATLQTLNTAVAEVSVPTTTAVLP